MKRQYKLDDPVAFYFDYLGKASGVSYVIGLHDRPFDLGPSLKQPDWSVNEILWTGLPVSITLGMSAMLIALTIGVCAGTIGGLRPGSSADYATQLLAILGISLPSFVIGSALLMFFAVKLGAFPVGGWGGISYIVLPAVTLSLPFAAYISRLVRFGMIEEMGADHIRTARAKGSAALEGRVQTRAQECVLASAVVSRSSDCGRAHRIIRRRKSIRSPRHRSTLRRRRPRQRHHARHGRRACLLDAHGGVQSRGRCALSIRGSAAGIVDVERPSFHAHHSSRGWHARVSAV
jgi:hypothetical protein